MIVLDGGRTALITRAEWGARAPKYTTALNPSFGTTAHWEGPSMPDFAHEACASYVRGIQNFHMNAKGWSDIAYTAVVCPHGWVFEGRWIGKRTGANGTNVGNGTAYAICFLGGIDDPYTSEADRAMQDTCAHLRRHGRAGKGVNCHRDWKATQCPGDVICGRVKAGAYSSDAPSPSPTPQPTPTPTPTPTPASTTEYSMDTLDLRNAHVTPVRGRHVDNLQALMVPLLVWGKRGDLVGPLLTAYGTPDGIAGKGTQTALKVCQDILRYIGHLQQSSSDMVCGPKTWKAIIEF